MLYNHLHIFHNVGGLVTVTIAYSHPRCVHINIMYHTVGKHEYIRAYEKKKKIKSHSEIEMIIYTSSIPHFIIVLQPLLIHINTLRLEFHLFFFFLFSIFLIFFFLYHVVYHETFSHQVLVNTQIFTTHLFSCPRIQPF